MRPAQLGLQFIRKSPHWKGKGRKGQFYIFSISIITPSLSLTRVLIFPICPTWLQLFGPLRPFLFLISRKKMQFHSTLDWHHANFYQKMGFNKWGRETFCLEINLILFRRRRKGKQGNRRGDDNRSPDSGWESSQHSFVPLEDKNNFGELELDFSSHVTPRHPDLRPGVNIQKRIRKK